MTGIRAELVPKSADYAGQDFPRFVIALGLSDMASAMADAQLPSQIRDADPLPPRQTSAMITKDMV